MRTTEFSVALALIVCLALASCAETPPQSAGTTTVDNGSFHMMTMSGFGALLGAGSNGSAPQISSVTVPNEYRYPPAPDNPQPNKICGPEGTNRPVYSDKPGYNQYTLQVADSSGKPISGLRQDDFSASLDNHMLAIEGFDSGPNQGPVSLAILVDTSGSMTPKLPVVTKTLKNLLATLDPCDEVVLMAFSKHVFLLQPLTTQHEIVARQLGLLHAYGQTAMYDALSQSLKILDQGHYPNRAILLITDGMDNASESSLDDVLGEEKGQHVPIYAIGIGDRNARSASQSFAIGPFTLPSVDDIDRVDANALNQLVAAGGGRVWIISTVAKSGSKSFGDAVDGVAAALGSGYSLGVVLPPNTGPGVKPQFTIKNHPDANVRVTQDALNPATQITETLTAQ